MDILKSTAVNKMVFMADSSDHVTGKTGLTLTITASKAGAAFASIAPTVTDRGSGWYSLSLTASHTDTVGDLVLHITGSGADPSDVKLSVAAQTATSISKSAFLATELAIGTVTSQTVFILTGGPTNDVANVMAIIFDASASDAPVVAEGSYVGSTGTLTLTAATGITVTTSDHVTLLSVAANTLGTDAISAAAVSAAAVTKIQTGLATPTNITAGTITTVTNLTNAPTTGDLTATMKASVTTAATAATPTAAAVTGAVGSVTGNVGGNVAGTVASVVGAVGSVTGDVGGNVTGSVGSVLGGINTSAGTITTLDELDTAQDSQHATTQGTLTTVAGYLDTEIAAILADTNELQTDWANGGRLDLLIDSIVAATVTFAEAYAAKGATPTLPQLLYEVRALLAEKAISGTTMTTKKIDGTTAAETFTLDSATAPTAITRAT